MLTVAIISDNTQLMTLQLLQTLTSSTCNDRDHRDIHSQGMRLAYRNFWNKRDVLLLAPLGHFFVSPNLVKGKMERFDVFTNQWLGTYFLTVPVPIEWIFGILLKLNQSSVNMV
jgi:hypothetical protein